MLLNFEGLGAGLTTDVLLREVLERSAALETVGA